MNKNLTNTQRSNNIQHEKKKESVLSNAEFHGLVLAAVMRKSFSDCILLLLYCWTPSMTNNSLIYIQTLLLLSLIVMHCI